MTDLRTIRQTLFHADLCSLSVLAIVAFYLGQWICRERPNLRRSVGRICILIFLGWLAIDLEYHGVEPIETVLAALFRATVFTGLVFPVACVLRLIADFFLDTFLSAPVRRWKRWREARRAKLSAQEADRLRRQQEHERKLAWERDRPNREAAERARKELQEREAQRLAIELQAAAAAQFRRDDARAHALLLFNQHAADIADRFPRPRFVEFMKRFMGDEQPPDVVERRGSELETVIVEHLKRVGISAKPATLADVLAWRDGQRAQLAAMGLDEEMRDYLERQLSEQFDRLLEQTLQGNLQ